jgi:hypothetical protein
MKAAFHREMEKGEGGYPIWKGKGADTLLVWF